MTATITKADFDRRLAATKLCGLAAQAAGLVLVQGKTQAEAARLVGVTQPAVLRAVRRLSALAVCGHCGHAS